MKGMPLRRLAGFNLAPHAVGLGVFAALQGLSWLFPSLRMGFFCLPASRLASLFLGMPEVDAEGAFVLMHPALDIRVVETCSGYDFFALLYAVLGGMVFRYARHPWRQIAVLLPAAYAIALGANSARIVCAAQARLHAEALAPLLSAQAAHFTVGVCIFATVLAASSLAARLIYERP